MGVARVYCASVNLLWKEPTARVYCVSVNLLMSETEQWVVLFDHDCEMTAELDYTMRLFIFPITPNEGMSEIYEWNTNIIRPRSGKEQRICLRQVPRLTLNVDAYISDEQEQARLQALLFAGQKSYWGVPMWSEHSSHTSDIDRDDTTIYVDTRWASYQDSGLALIWQAPDTYEMISIDTVYDDRLELASPVLSDFTGLKWIVPLRIGHIKTYTKTDYKADGYANFNCQLSVMDNFDIQDGWTPETTYKDLPVITPATLEIDGLSLSVDGNNIVTDYQLGKFDVFSDSNFNIYTQQHIFRRTSKSTCWDFKQFIHYLYGRQVAVWIPTYKNDMDLLETIESSDTILTTQPIGWAEEMGLNDLRTDMAFVFPDGSLILREIVNLEHVTDSQGNATCYVTIDSSLGQQVNVGECELSFLDKCRLTDDKVKLVYDEPFRFYCDVNFTRCEE